MSEVIIKAVLMIALLVSTICYFYAAKKGSKKIEIVGLTSLIASLIFAYTVK
jgi:hypothetical protein